MILSTAVACLFLAAPPQELKVRVRQITSGPRHHFFGYIGHVRTIPWNGSGRTIVALRSSFQDHLPGPDEAADVVLLDARNGYAVRKVDETRGWNPQQGTMLYWNPKAPETQFFFNDRDRKTGRLFTVLFDVAGNKRIREFRYEDASFANSGVAQAGGAFLGINYGRMARLRPVTGYREAHDWTRGVKHPADDGIFRVDVATGEKKLIVSFERLREALEKEFPFVKDTPLFINHTLWNRTGDRIFFFARGGWRSDPGPGEKKLNVPFLVRPDGTGLVRMKDHIGGHPEWAEGHTMIGAIGSRQVLYDTDRQEVSGTLGDKTIFPRPGGDIALSPDGRLFVNGYRKGGHNHYVVYRRRDKAFVRTRRFDQHGWTRGDVRNDPAPCWNRDGTKILFPSIADDAEKSRQLFIIELTRN